jgi:hypothetical protein
MTELKTLNEIKSIFEVDWKEKLIQKPEDYEKLVIMKQFLDNNFIKKEDIKKEAIKWVKTDKRYFRVITKENDAPLPHLSPGGTSIIIEDNSKITQFNLDINLRRFLFYFFNLTEEDLEGKE